MSISRDQVRDIPCGTSAEDLTFLDFLDADEDANPGNSPCVEVSSEIESLGPRMDPPSVPFETNVLGFAFLDTLDAEEAYKESTGKVVLFGHEHEDDVDRALVGPPTMRSIRRMTNLAVVLAEINRKPLGIDGFPWESYLRPIAYSRWNPRFRWAYPQLDPLRTIQETLMAPNVLYLPDATRLAWVKGRPIEIGTVASRLVERAAVRKLSSYCDKHLFNEACWGYRVGRSTEMAIKDVQRAVRSGWHFALKTDIKSFFPSVNREMLEFILRELLNDQDLCDFLMSASSPYCPGRERGLPQGNGLSPLLGNLFLTVFDVACSELRLWRWADDLLVLTRTEEELRQARQIVERATATLHLRLNSEKTFERDLHQHPLIFLGFELRGGNIFPSGKAIEKLRSVLRIRGKKDCQDYMKAFAQRYSVGKVRKLFRRLDRELKQQYPQGWTLTGLLDQVRGGRGGQKGRHGLSQSLPKFQGQGCKHVA